MSISSENDVMADDTSIRVTEELADELFDKKRRGETYEDVIWRLIEESETASSGHEPRGEGLEDAPPEPSSTPTEGHAVREEAEHALRNLGLPGRGDDLEERIEALLAMHDLLREHEGERVEAGQLKEVAEQYAHGYADADSFWTNCVKKNSAQERPNALKALPGVREAGTGEYTYSPDSAEGER